MKKKKIIICMVVVAIAIVVLVYNFTSKKGETEIENSINEITMQEVQPITEENQVLGTLKIEKIGLEAPVREGSSSEVLKEYIGHIEESSMFDGNVGLAAHNRGNEFSYFSRLKELVEGDTVEYITNYGTRTYKVNTVKVILETDWTMLANSNENKLTMITCISNRPTQRLCVQAVEI